MAENLTSTAVLSKLLLTDTEENRKEFQLSGTVPASLSSTEVKKTLTILGITPEDFAKDYASTEFDFSTLKEAFNTYCKDFNDELRDGVASKALEFSSKMLFELGPYIRNEKKNKGDKAIRFRFAYTKNVEGSNVLRIKTVIVSTFKEILYNKMEENDMLILTFKQAGLLAMVTFLKAVEFCYNKGATQVMLMTPLCGAVFSRDSVTDMAKELDMSETDVLKVINSSTTAGGQHLDESDLACSVAAMIAATRRVTDKNIRNSMITKLIKQYSNKHKVYHASRFNIFAKYALGGVPPGMDADTLIESFSNIQVAQVSLRAATTAVKQSEKRVETDIIPTYTQGTVPDKPTTSTAKRPPHIK